MICRETAPIERIVCYQKDSRLGTNFYTYCGTASTVPRLGGDDLTLLPVDSEHLSKRKGLYLVLARTVDVSGSSKKTVLALRIVRLVVFASHFISEKLVFSKTGVVLRASHVAVENITTS